MKDRNIIQEKDFRYEIFKPSVGSDSGVLMLATKLTDESVQYVVKCQIEWNPASEFIYHKVGASLGVYTQEVKLFKRLLEAKYACGIRYCANACKVNDFAADDPNRSDFFRFMALYQILNEEDSEEFYTNEQNRLFKVDNAEAFILSSAYGLLVKKAKTKSQWIKMAIDEELERYLRKTNEQFYPMMADKILEASGKEAMRIYLDTFIKFAELDISVLDEAFTSLDKVYPKTFSEYLRRFLEIRQPICRELAENERGKTT
jgi:hypothetical protein